jgi:molybdopterin-containing oxidoreductase family iron-sulfur binding subunit
VTFAPDAHVYDGRFANSSWLLELPDPMTKVTWDNVALVSPATARKLGLSDGDTLTVTVAGKSATLGALVAPGQADDSIGLTLGFGRKQVGRVGLGTGVSTMALRPSTGTGLVEGTVAKAGGKFEIARTQEHHTMDAPMAGGRVHHRPLVRETSLTKFVQKPDFVQESEEPSAKHLFSLFPDYKYDGHRWSMVIDLGTCIGCSACLTACQAENNIPVVGKKGVIMSREMHWIRIDRYFSGDDENEPAAVMQPITCQHCENAPCEQVCPVGATTHSPEGLNDMAYNRCIGTRYCANNCPFKVRRFNFFNYNRDVPEIRRMQFNPEVTVRSRGVIEKCSYCVQRINKAKIAAHREGREYVKDGEVRTACQQACPAGAISFGNLNDAEAQVTKAAAQPRKYQLLTELNVRPRTQFLGRVRNPNPELV